MSGVRFCMITTFYPPHNFGGDGLGIQRLSEALVRRGHHVTVIHDCDAFDLLSDKQAKSAPSTPEGLTVHRLASPLGSFSSLLTHQTGRPIVHGRRIRRIVEEGHFDVINFHNISLVGGPGILRVGTGLKLYMAHEHWLVCPTHVLWRHRRERCDGKECLRCVLHHRRPPQIWRGTGFLERELRHIDTFIAMSEFSRRKHAEFGFPREMEVLPYFLPEPDPEPPETETESSPHPRPYFLFVGRLERIKGLDDVIPIFWNDLGADLLIAGEGEHGDTLKNLAEGIEGVRFLGRIDPDSLARYYRHARALIVPSVCFETFGIILIESFRQGTPVIVRNVGPLPEIVRKAGAGEIFDDAEGLKQAMARFLRDDGHRRRCGEAGRRAFRDYWSEGVVVPAYLDLVEKGARKRGLTQILERLRQRN